MTNRNQTISGTWKIAVIGTGCLIAATAAGIAFYYYQDNQKEAATEEKIGKSYKTKKKLVEDVNKTPQSFLQTMCSLFSTGSDGAALTDKSYDQGHDDQKPIGEDTHSSCPKYSL